MEMEFLTGDNDYDPLAMRPRREPDPQPMKDDKKRSKRRAKDKKVSDATPKPAKTKASSARTGKQDAGKTQTIGTGSAPPKKQSGGRPGCCGRGSNRVDEDLAARVHAYNGQGSARAGEVLEVQLGGDDGTRGLNLKTLEVLLYQKTARLRKVRLDYKPHWLKWNSRDA